MTRAKRGCDPPEFQGIPTIYPDHAKKKKRKVNGGDTETDATQDTLVSDLSEVHAKTEPHGNESPSQMSHHTEVTVTEATSREIKPTKIRGRPKGSNKKSKSKAKNSKHEQNDEFSIRKTDFVFDTPPHSVSHPESPHQTTDTLADVSNPVDTPKVDSPQQQSPIQHTQPTDTTHEADSEGEGDDAEPPQDGNNEVDSPLREQIDMLYSNIEEEEEELPSPAPLLLDEQTPGDKESQAANDDTEKVDFVPFPSSNLEDFDPFDAYDSEVECDTAAVELTTVDTEESHIDTVSKTIEHSETTTTVSKHAESPVKVSSVHIVDKTTITATVTHLGVTETDESQITSEPVATEDSSISPSKKISSKPSAAVSQPAKSSSTLSKIHSILFPQTQSQPSPPPLPVEPLPAMETTTAVTTKAVPAKASGEKSARATYLSDLIGLATKGYDEKKNMKQGTTYQPTTVTSASSVNDTTTPVAATAVAAPASAAVSAKADKSTTSQASLLLSKPLSQERTTIPAVAKTTVKAAEFESLPSTTTSQLLLSSSNSTGAIKPTSNVTSAVEESNKQPPFDRRMRSASLSAVDFRRKDASSSNLDQIRDYRPFSNLNGSSSQSQAAANVANDVNPPPGFDRRARHASEGRQFTRPYQQRQQQQQGFSSYSRNNNSYNDFNYQNRQQQPQQLQQNYFNRGGYGGGMGMGRGGYDNRYRNPSFRRYNNYRGPLPNRNFPRNNGRMNPFDDDIDDSDRQFDAYLSQANNRQSYRQGGGGGGNGFYGGNGNGFQQQQQFDPLLEQSELFDDGSNTYEPTLPTADDINFGNPPMPFQQLPPQQQRFNAPYQTPLPPTGMMGMNNNRQQQQMYGGQQQYPQQRRQQQQWNGYNNNNNKRSYLQMQGQQQYGGPMRGRRYQGGGMGMNGMNDFDDPMDYNGPFQPFDDEDGMGMMDDFPPFPPQLNNRRNNFPSQYGRGMGQFPSQQFAQFGNNRMPFPMQGGGRFPNRNGNGNMYRGRNGYYNQRAQQQQQQMAQMNQFPADEEDAFDETFMDNNGQFDQIMPPAQVGLQGGNGRFANGSHLPQSNPIPPQPPSLRQAGPLNVNDNPRNVTEHANPLYTQRMPSSRFNDRVDGNTKGNLNGNVNGSQLGSNAPPAMIPANITISRDPRLQFSQQARRAISTNANINQSNQPSNGNEKAANEGIWKEWKTAEGKCYYHHSVTGVTTWEKPANFVAQS